MGANQDSQESIEELLALADQKDEEDCVKPSESTHIARIQLILAEKRTSLSVLRTGLGLITLPMSVVTLLVATSRYYEIINNLHFLIPLFLLNSILVTMGFVLVIRAWQKILRQDDAIQRIKQSSVALVKLSEKRGGSSSQT